MVTHAQAVCQVMPVTEVSPGSVAPAFPGNTGGRKGDKIAAADVVRSTSMLQQLMISSMMLLSLPSHSLVGD
jgi:hypothetical protein